MLHSTEAYQFRLVFDFFEIASALFRKAQPWKFASLLPCPCHSDSLSFTDWLPPKPPLPCTRWQLPASFASLLVPTACTGGVALYTVNSLGYAPLAGLSA